MAEFSRTVKITVETERGKVMDGAALLNDIFDAMQASAETRNHPQFGQINVRVETP